MYNVTLMVDGKTVETKPIKVVFDPGVKFQGTQQKQYFDMTADLHDLERRGTEVATKLQTVFDQMAGVAAKVKESTTVPAAVKLQFETFNKEFDALRVKFGVPVVAGGGGGGRGGGGGGGRGGGGAAGAAAGTEPAVDPTLDLLGRTGDVKNAISGIWEWPSESLMKEYSAVKLGLPKAITEANGWLVRAMTMSQTLRKYDITLNVPVPTAVK
jgi:hypothetical protein